LNVMEGWWGLKLSRRCRRFVKKSAGRKYALKGYLEEMGGLRGGRLCPFRGRKKKKQKPG